MLKMRTDEERIVAVLHDVVEDGDVSLDALRERGFADALVTAVACLTKQAGETYESFVQGAAGNPLARTVKIADIEDNLDLKRLPQLTDADKARAAKYHRALQVLRGVARASEATESG